MAEFDTLPYEEYEPFVCGSCTGILFIEVKPIGFLVSKQKISPLDPPIERKRRITIPSDSANTRTITCVGCFATYKYVEEIKSFRMVSNPIR